MKTLLLILALALAAAPLARAAEDIVVEGRDSVAGTWPNIDDEDLNPNQVVTDFGNVDTGSSKGRTFRVRNSGNATLTVDSVTSDDPRFTVTNLSNGSTIAAGNSDEFTITFSPTALGVQQAVITIRNSDPDSENVYRFAVEGTGTGPEILVGGRVGTSGTFYAIFDGDTSPSTDSGTSFGTIAAGTTRTRYFRVENSGNQSLNVAVPTFTGSGASSFSVQSLSSAVNIGAGNDRAFEIRFSPSTAGSKTATFSMGTNDANENPYNFTVTGTATGTPDIVVEGNDSIGYPNIDDGDLIPDQVVTNFGNVNMGSSEFRYYRIRNTGTDTLIISARSSSSPQFTFESFATSIAPGAEDIFYIRFTPTTYGETSTTITLSSNDPDSESTYTFAVKGNGLGAEIRIGGGSAAGGAFTTILDGDNTPAPGEGTNFGTVSINAPVTRYFRIYNEGSDGLNVQAPVMGGTGAGHFKVSGINSAFNIGAGSSRDFQIEFDPTTPGTKTATFSLSSNDSNESPYTFDLTGVSIGSPSISVEGSNGVTWPDIDDGDLDANQGVTDFGSVNLNTSVPRTFRVRNQGTGVLNITGVTSSNARYTVTGLAGSVAAGGQEEFTVNFAPLVRGTAQTVITINSSAAGGLASYTFGLTGKGKGPEIKIEVWRTKDQDATVHEIQHNDFTPSDADGTIIDTTAVFGYDDTSIRITNLGDDGLDISPPSISGPGQPYFSVINIQAITNIAPGNFRDFEVRFQPAVAGEFQVQIAIPSNDGDEGIFRFDIKGTAVATARPSLQRYTGIAWVDAHLKGHDMGNVNLGAYDDVRYRLKNTGAGALTFSHVGDLDPQFSLRGITLPYTLAPESEKEFTVRFTPEDFATSTAGVAFFAGGQDEPELRTDLTATGIGAAILVEGLGSDGNYREITDGATIPQTADGTDFGSHDIGGGKLDHTFRVTNTGNRNLVITDGYLSGNTPAQFDISNLQFLLYNVNISPGNSQTFKLSFDPDSPGLKTAAMSLNSIDSVAGPFNFRIKGIGFGYPEIEVKGRSGALDPFNDITDGDTITRTTDGTSFGNVGVTNDSVIRTFKIKNTGSDVLNITSVTENSPHFTLNSALTSIPAGDEGEFTVTFNPSTYGNLSGTVEIECDDANEGTFTFAVSGSGRAAEMELRGGAGQNTVITDGDNTPSATDFTDFGVVNISGTMLPRTFAIRNLGNETLQVTAMNSTDGQFVISGLSLPLNLAAGAVQNFQITFDPSSIGQKLATVSFTSDDPDEATYNFRVKGYGGNDQPEIQVIGDNSAAFTSGQTVVTTAAGTDFGNVTAGAGSASRTFNIYNSGTGNLTISGITDDAAAFAISGAPTTVGALSWGSFTVTCSPATASTHQATISIANNDADEAVFTFAVRGTGVAAPPPARPEIGLFGGETLANAIGAGDTSPQEAKGTDLGEVEIGTSITRTFRIRNTGTASLTISSATFASAPRFTVAGVASSIPAGGFDDFTVTYTPTNEGPTTRVLTITNTDENEAAYAITFTAVAVAPPGSLAVTKLEPAGNKMSITFTSIPGRTYRIMRSDDMQSWVGVAGLAGLTGDPEPQSYPLPQGNTGRRFWRVEQE